MSDQSIAPCTAPLRQTRYLASARRSRVPVALAAFALPAIACSSDMLTSLPTHRTPVYTGVPTNGARQLRTTLPVLTISDAHGRRISAFAVTAALDSAARHAFALQIRDAIEGGSPRKAGAPRIHVTQSTRTEIERSVAEGRVVLVGRGAHASAPVFGLAASASARPAGAYESQMAVSGATGWLQSVCPDCDPDAPGYDPDADPTPIYTQVAAMEAQVNAGAAELSEEGCFASTAASRPIASTGNRLNFEASEPQDCEGQRFAYYWAVAGFAGSALFTVGSAAYGNVAWAWQGLKMTFSALGAVNIARYALKECRIDRERRAEPL